MNIGFDSVGMMMLMSCVCLLCSCWLSGFGWNCSVLIVVWIVCSVVGLMVCGVLIVCEMVVIEKFVRVVMFLMVEVMK